MGSGIFDDSGTGSVGWGRHTFLPMGQGWSAARSRMVCVVVGGSDEGWLEVDYCEYAVTQGRAVRF